MRNVPFILTATAGWFVLGFAAAVLFGRWCAKRDAEMAAAAFWPDAPCPPGCVFCRLDRERAEA